MLKNFLDTRIAAGRAWRNAPRLLAMLGIATLGLAAATPSSAQTLDELREKGSLNIGMLVDYPPFGILDAQGKPSGYDADVIALLSDHLGIEANIVPVTGPNRIPYLQTGRLDLLVATLAITPERSKQVQFSKPYAGIDMVLFGKTDVDLPTAESLSGHNIGVARGSTQDIAITKLAPEGALIQRFDDDALAIQSLLSGQVDAIGVGELVVQEIQKVAPAGAFEVKFSLFQQVQGIAMRLDQPELLEAINGFLDEVTADGSLDQIHQKWLGSPLPQFSAQQ